jgi:tRNA (mo5U34)-methyltransferase
VPRDESIRAKVARRLPRGRAVHLGPISVRQQWDGVLVGPGSAHPVYGRSYREEPLPGGLAPSALQEYVDRSIWYHEIDLGNGVRTKGVKPRDSILTDWEVFGLGDLTGKSVVDIGGLDGAYAFLAEQAGASRVAVLDHYVWSTDYDHYRRIYLEAVEAGEVPPAPHESPAWHPDTTPSRWRFDTARQALNSGAEGICLDFMDCNLAEVGAWDVVLFLGVLYHLTDPIGALKRVAAITREQALIETEAMYVPGHREPLWRFFPGGELAHDRSNWWVPNIEALVALTSVAGFAKAEVLVGEPEHDATRGEARHFRAIVRALKG